ncbi:uncharacterized protein KY384_000771 [Bacidia gigantensis]|uniref:uncharacterized protein n=1 Tax=Bacidia gigantensis TaxID=2732470 RepID=UPI001D03D88B|nr:uncharacterized protein KY384_000771 [Bacidia gigantensis]KAG8526009.1 hypothetical protein KY384_000771 [Bacidia gigantensis]
MDKLSPELFYLVIENLEEDMYKECSQEWTHGKGWYLDFRMIPLEAIFNLSLTNHHYQALVTPTLQKFLDQILEYSEDPPWFDPGQKTTDLAKLQDFRWSYFNDIQWYYPSFRRWIIRKKRPTTPYCIALYPDDPGGKIYYVERFSCFRRSWPVGLPEEAKEKSTVAKPLAVFASFNEDAIDLKYLKDTNQLEISAKNTDEAGTIKLAK